MLVTRFEPTAEELAAVHSDADKIALFDKIMERAEWTRLYVARQEPAIEESFFDRLMAE